MSDLAGLSVLTAPLTRSDGAERWIDLGYDPQVSNQVGAAIAAILSARGVTVVLSLEGEEEAVLAHVAASAMHARRVTVVQERGLLFTSADLPPESTVALVATQLTNFRPLLPVATMMRDRGHRFDCAITLDPPQLHTNL
ncbi:hypothetical protein ABT369_49180 [Dactylosporangium sp. NPDC000244]|uniref:hypothetical protein n=1 Tax=Dactylosporangium sp. NPDC000244 TaxID=3154365 RepID=UPI0033286B4D